MIMKTRFALAASCVAAYLHIIKHNKYTAKEVDDFLKLYLHFD